MTEEAGTVSPSSSWSSPWPFFVAVFAWSWAFWIAIAALGINTARPLGQRLELIGLLGPMLGGIGFTYLTRNKAGRRDYWARLLDPRRIRPAWCLVIVLFAPVLWTLAVSLDIASGQSAAPSAIGDGLASLLNDPATILSLLVWTILFGPVPEEMGWRGYVLDRLQERWNALTASLILGAIWALYHLPLFYMQGTYHHAKGAGSAWFWFFLVQIIPVAIVFTWIFNNTRRSTLAAILFHFVINLTAMLANKTDRTNVYATLLWIAAAGAVVGWGGAATLTRRRSL